MSVSEITGGSIHADEIQLDPGEAARQLQTQRGFSNDTIAACLSRLCGTIDCKYAAIRVAVAYPGETGTDLGFGRIESRDLRRNLKSSREAYLFAVTLGIGVDRLLNRLTLTSQAEHFITDALASAAAEAACDIAEQRIKKGLLCRPRYSPGYGDLPLTVQPQLLTVIDAYRRLGITLNRSLLMSPMKSITAIMGICNGT